MTVTTTPGGARSGARSPPRRRVRATAAQRLRADRPAARAARAARGAAGRAGPAHRRRRRGHRRGRRGAARGARHQPADAVRRRADRRAVDGAGAGAARGGDGGAGGRGDRARPRPGCGWCRPWAAGRTAWPLYDVGRVPPQGASAGSPVLVVRDCGMRPPRGRVVSGPWQSVLTLLPYLSPVAPRLMRQASARGRAAGVAGRGGGDRAA